MNWNDFRISAFIFFILFLGGVCADQSLNFEVRTQLNSLSTSFYARTDSLASSGYDSYDLLALDSPSDYSSFFSRITDGGTKDLNIDTWNATANSGRSLNLIYRVLGGGNSTGSLAISWDSSKLTPSGDSGRYFFSLKDYGSDSSRTTVVGSADMNSLSSYNVSNSISTRYFKIETDYDYCGDGVKNSWEQCDGSDLGGSSCTSIGGYSGGTLACSASCTFSTGGCTTGGTGSGCSSSAPSCSVASELDCGVRESKGANCAGPACSVVGTKCSSGFSCVEGTCVSSCGLEDCSPGQKRCLGQRYQECSNATGCFRWGLVESCRGGTSCVDGTCVPCSSSCSSLGFQCGSKEICGVLTNCGSCSKGICIQGICRNANESIGDGLESGGQAGLEIKNCSSDYICSPWSNCEVSYDMDILLVEKGWFAGKRYRTCFDSNQCRATLKDEEDCSLKKEVFLKDRIVCGVRYTEIYEKGTRKLLSRVRRDSLGDKKLTNIFLMPGEVDCEEDVDPFDLSWRDSVMFILDIRNLWRLLS